VVLGDLLLNFLHDLYFAFEELSESANGTIFAFLGHSVLEWVVGLPDFVYEGFSDLLLGARDDEVKELFIADN